MYKAFGKRTLDIIIAGVALVVLSPVFALITLLVRGKLGSPVIFRQVRGGYQGAHFQALKFRSMTDAVAPDGTLLPDEDRLTPFGKWLRASNLDELPGLWNVLRGDMSLVGPRPLLTEYLPLYSEEQRRRHDIRPGLTGWAQVRGRNNLSWKEKFALDLWYVDNYSLGFDLKILALTVNTVLKRDGISPDGSVIMPRFRGNDETT